MKRLLTSIALLLSLTAAALGQNRKLPEAEIRGSDVGFGSVLKLGTRVNGVYTSTPDRLQILGSGSTGDVSNMTVTPTYGGIARSLTDLFSTQLYAINFGVVPGAADSGPALRTALTRAQDLSARLILPPGVINVCGGTDPEALLRIERFMDLVGTSQKSRIEPCADAGNRAVLMVKPLTNGGGIRGMVMRDFSIGIPGVQRNYGCDAIKLDTTNKNGFIAKLLVENIGTSSRGAGCYGLNHVNVYTTDTSTTPPTHLTGNPTGGVFGSTFRDSDFIGGMRFQLTGDSNNIERNIIAGPNEGIYYNAIHTGAAAHRITGNNITATGDTIVIDAGQQVYITENQLEAVGDYTGSRTNPAVITILGTLSVAIRNNNINAYTRSDAVAALNGASGVVIEDNTVNYGTGKYLLRAANSPNNAVERQLYEGYNSTNITGKSRVLLDAASITMGVWQQLTTLNNWTTGPDTNFRQGLWWMPLRDGGIRLSGVIAGGTTTAGTAIAALPAPYRPSKALRFPAMTYTANLVNGTAWGMGVFIVDAGGNINIQAVPTMAATGSFLQFDGANFNIRPQ